jgi:hypothetical protein
LVIGPVPLFRPERSSLRFIGDQENAFICRLALFPGEQALRDLPHMIRRGYEHEPEE